MLKEALCNIEIPSIGWDGFLISWGDFWLNIMTRNPRTVIKSPATNATKPAPGSWKVPKPVP